MAADLSAAIGAAGRQGRRDLTEPESYAAARVLGIGVPVHLVVGSASEVDEAALAAFCGDRVVVKAVADDLVHKSAVGAVRTVLRNEAAVAAAIEEVSAAAAGFRLAGFLVAARVDSTGPELMLGFRRTPGFGPVVILGAGGGLVNAAGDVLPTAVLPVPCDREAIERAVRDGPGDLVGDPDRVVAALVSVVSGAAGLPEEIAELDLNPVVMTPGGLVALDAFCRLGAVDAPPPDRDPGALDAVLRPATIGIVGVSSGENPGRAILRNVLGAGFPPDRVVVVKAGVDRIDGVRCVPDLAALGGGVDLLVVAVAAAAAADVVEVVAAGDLARAVVLIPGGMGERAGSEELAERVRSVVRRCRSERRGPLVVGGNCMGIRSLPGGYDTTFIPPERLAASRGAPEAPLAVVSQSGAFAIARLDRFPRLRPRYLVTVGNQVDVTVGEVLDYVSRDPQVAVAACYVEGFPPGDGSRFVAATRRLTGRGGTVVLALGGRTGPGMTAAASHTAAIATDGRVAAALAEQAGALVAASLDDFEDLVRVATLLGDRVAGRTRLGAVTNAGFEAVAIADALGPLTLAEFAPPTRAALGTVLAGAGIGEVVAVRNPLDLTPMADDAAFGEAARAVLDDPDVDLAVIGCVPLTPALRSRASELGEGSIGSVLAALAEHPKPWIAVVDGGARYEALRSHLEEAGVAVFTTADRAVRALGRLAGLRAGR